MEVVACTLAAFVAVWFVVEAFIGLIDLLVRDARRQRMRALADEIMRERFGNHIHDQGK